MTGSSAGGAPPRSPLSAAAGPTAVLALAAAVLAAVRPWGDTGVTATGTFDDARPAVHVVGLAAVAVLAVGAVFVPRRRRVAGVVAGLVVTVLGVGVLLAVRAVTGAQVFPRDGGWWGLVSAAGSVVAGVLLLLVPLGAPRGRAARWAGRAVAVVVPLALVVTAGLVAPGWPDHVVDGRYPATFSEAPGPATVTKAGWRTGTGPGGVQAVIGGRLVQAADDRTGGRCGLLVRAFDLASGRPVWQSQRPLRCDGPALAAVDGNNTVVRVTLRGPQGELTGPPTTVYLGTVDGRVVRPSAALDAVRWWTEGFGLVVDDDTVRGLDPRTGVTTWLREIPRCDDGSRATPRVPAAPAAGRPLIRTPYDTLGGVPGTQRVAGTGTDVVLPLSCGTQPRVWVVDVLGSATDDHVVTLPVPAAGEGDLGAVTFLPWLDTVVAVVPTAVDAGRVTGATLVGVTLASGAVAWIRPVGTPLTTTVSPVDGSIRVLAATGTSTGGATVSVLDVGTGAVRSTGPTSPAVASLTLTAASVDVTDRTATVTTATGDTRTIALTDCDPDTAADAPAPLLAGPGGVAVRCATAQGTSTIGLVP